MNELKQLTKPCLVCGTIPLAGPAQVIGGRLTVGPAGAGIGPEQAVCYKCLETRPAEAQAALAAAEQDAAAGEGKRRAQAVRDAEQAVQDAEAGLKAARELVISRQAELERAQGRLGEALKARDRLIEASKSAELAARAAVMAAGASYASGQIPASAEPVRAARK